MSQPIPSLLLADQILGVLKRASKYLKKSAPDQKLAACQNKIARSYGYPNWAILHKNVCEMTQSQLEIFAAHIEKSVNFQTTLPTQTRPASADLVKCTLFTKNLIGLAREFKPGEAQAIVLSDSKKIQTMMESNHAYYYNSAKIYMHIQRLHEGLFEVPLVVPRANDLHWIEGFHQVTAAIEKGMTVIPIGTSLALAPTLKSLVGTSDPRIRTDQYDFSGCKATVM